MIKIKAVKKLNEARETATLSLTITVTYDLNGVTEYEMKKHLKNAAQHLADNGLLSGESAADVTDWSVQVETR